MDRDELIIQKRQEYLNYIEEHINNVKKAWANLISITAIQSFLAGFDNSRQLIAITADNIKVHDKSKYSEEEFEPYRRHFHSVNEKEKEESTFDYGIAWQHHKDNNKHHWEYWSERHIVNDMPWQYVVEMFCDHAAMSIKFGGTALEWFNEQLANKKIEVGEIQKTSYLKLAKLYYDKY